MKLLSTLHSAFVASSAARPSLSTAASVRMSSSGSDYTLDDLGKKYPELLVFDADACFWDKEMYEMRSMPGETVKGDLGVTMRYL